MNYPTGQKRSYEHAQALAARDMAQNLGFEQMLVNLSSTRGAIANSGSIAKSFILVGFSIINHPCWGTPFRETSILICSPSSHFLDVYFFF